jgi:osmotically inducible lipoprotein OsmB
MGISNVVLMGLAAVLLTACGSTMGERAASGAAIGAGAGAVGAKATGGNVLSGAVIGGAVGAIAGGLSK